MLQLVIIAVYLVGMLAIGVLNRRRARIADEFFVAGRQGSSLLITGSLLATIIGGSATLGMADLGFNQGLTGAWWLLVGSIGLLFLGLFFAERIRRFGLYTLPELIEKQYDNRISLASSVLIVVSWLGIIAAQIVASGKILGVLGIGDPVIWMIIFTLVFITYSILGGQHAIIRTDTAQIIIIFIGIFSGMTLLLSKLGGLAGLRASLPAEQFAFPLSLQFGPVELVSLLLIVGLTYLVGPDMYSRVFCAKDDKTARRAVLWAALLIIPFALAITIMGMGASALFPEAVSEQALPMIISELLPPVIGGIVLAALLCAIMSSADTTLLTASTILSVDIIKRIRPSLNEKDTLYLTRWGIAGLGIASLVLALALKGIISSLLFAYTIYTCGLIPSVIAGFYKDRLKVTSTGALAAIIGGGATGLISKVFGIQYLDLGGLLAGIILLFAVSMVDNRLKGKRLDDRASIN